MTDLGLLLLVLAVCCNNGSERGESEHRKKGFQWIEKQEAFEMMKKYSNYRVVDVRSKEEYMSGHLPRAINLPLDNLEEECMDTLPNQNQVIFVYCTSGTRSRQACEMMTGLGYTNIYGFGGFQK